MLRSTFSTTTMASSTTMPTASTSPNSDRLFSEKPNIAMRKNVPISETGMATSGMMAARQVCRNRMTTSTTSRIASRIVSMHRVDRLLDELGRVVDDRVLARPCGNRLDASVHRRADRLARSRARSSPAAGTPRSRPPDRGRDRSSTNSPAPASSTRADVLAGAPPRSAVCLTTMLPNSLGIGEPAERLHRDLERAGLGRPAAG